MHIPVLLEAVVQEAQATSRAMGRGLHWIVDGTFGRGGHLAPLLKEFPESRAIAVDKDLDAIAYGEAHFNSPQVQFFHADYKEFFLRQSSLIQELTSGQGLDLILLDLGVSSPQLDLSERGFSFYHDGPLDMRMDRSQALSAKDVINYASPSELTRIFLECGEIHRSHRVVDAIVADRKTKPFATTLELAGLIERVFGWRRRGHHPATEFFLALRIHINGELEGIAHSLRAAIENLAVSGRLLLITFHSLEDRQVKNVFRSLTELGAPVYKKVIQPSYADIKKNPRCRSAKLRVFERKML